MGAPRPQFTLICQSPNKEEVEKAAAEYQAKHPGHKVYIDSWKDLLTHDNNSPGIWRARVWKTPEDRSLLDRLLDTIRR
ncbi:MAG: hypothetical protein RMM17_09675 [Acidobacteriota bacterium]|nr:hypothetical protein [Blastocatellia bacterium]MDW8412937.1 hypothetical protein [Acidobacteriota bacterium]